MKDTLLRTALLALVLIAVGVPASARTWDDALAAYKQGDYKKAAGLFQKAAEQGNPSAQFDLGLMYQKGIGVDADLAKAVKWYRKAAEQGYARAQNNLGLMLASGRGTTQDDAEAAKWFGKAAGQGESMAQVNLGLDYFQGKGVPKDLAKADMWFAIAAAGKNKAAQHNQAAAEHVMTPQQVAQARKMAQEWLAKHG